MNFMEDEYRLHSRLQQWRQHIHVNLYGHLHPDLVYVKLLHLFIAV